MEFSVKGRRVLLLAFFSTFAALAVSFSLYYLIDYKRGRKKGSFIDIYKNLDQEKTPSCVAVDLELAEILKENGHGEFTKGTIYKLLELLEKVEDCMLEKLLVAFLNCSAFTTNQVKFCVSHLTLPGEKYSIPDILMHSVPLFLLFTVPGSVAYLPPPLPLSLLSPGT